VGPSAACPIRDSKEEPADAEAEARPPSPPRAPRPAGRRAHARRGRRRERARGAGGQTLGPDVTVIQLTDINNNGVAAGIRGYSIGTTSCNVGSQPVAWCNSLAGCGGGLLAPEDHPVIAQNLYGSRTAASTRSG